MSVCLMRDDTMRNAVKHILLAYGIMYQRTIINGILNHGCCTGSGRVDSQKYAVFSLAFQQSPGRISVLTFFGYHLMFSIA